MARDKKFFRLEKHPLKVRHMEVVQVAQLTPGMRRVTFGGADLAGFTSLAPEDHIKVFFPAEGQERPVVPVIGPLGIPLPLNGKPLARDYTVRRFDAARCLLDIDFFLHGDAGVAARWAAQAAPGQQLALAGPRGSFVLTEKFDWQLFIGDETALPEIARRIEDLPGDTRAIAVLAVDDAHEQQPLISDARLQVEWLHRKTLAGSVADAYVAALTRVLPSEGRGFIWLAGEASEVRTVYNDLVRVRGIARDQINASGHWKRGVVNHDHHEEIDA